MKKILLSALLLLSFAAVRPAGLSGLENALKYAETLSALELALKGNQQGFVDLINLAKDEMGNIDFTKLTSVHVENFVSLAKTAMNNENSQVRTAAKNFISALIPKIQEMVSQDPGTFLPLLEKLQGLVGSGSGVPSSKEIFRLRM